MPTRIHQRSVCPHDCPDTCSMVVRLEDDRAVAVRGNPDHEFTKGFLCHKVARYVERVYHPERVLTPLIRNGPKGSGQFRSASWEDASKLIAERLDDARHSPEGPQSILPYSYCGTMGRIQGESLDRRFFHAIGASLLDRTICASAGKEGFVATVGAMLGMQPEAFSGSQFIINWGSNTAVTNIHLWVRMMEARKAGARIVTIDPYRSLTAERSDQHIAPRVGTDAALALGMVAVIFKEQLEDQEYLEEYCEGGEQLRDHVREHYGLNATAKITGLKPETIHDLAVSYATTKPAAIRVNYGVQRHRGGGMAVRTISCLPAITGAWRHESGGILLSTSGNAPLNTDGLQRPDLIPAGTRTVNMVQLAEALHGEIAGPPVRVLFVYNSNPAAVSPDLGRVLTGLTRDDLFTVVHEQFLTDTADYADVVLPATTQLEHFDLHSAYGHNWIQLNEPAIPPIGESRSNTDVFRDLAGRLDLADELFAPSDEALARVALWESESECPEELRGITVQRLRTEGPLRLQNLAAAPFATGGFPTPSGRCRLINHDLNAHGLPSLPDHVPPAESAETRPDHANQFPLQLLSPPARHFLNSTFVNIESLRKSAGVPELDIHPQDAGDRGIRDGEQVRIFNERGSFEARACLRDSVRTGVVMAPGIWWNKLSDGVGNSNLTTSTRLTDLGGGATFFDNLVEVERIPTDANDQPAR